MADVSAESVAISSRRMMATAAGTTLALVVIGAVAGNAKLAVYSAIFGSYCVARAGLPLARVRGALSQRATAVIRGVLVLAFILGLLAAAAALNN